MQRIIFFPVIRQDSRNTHNFVKIWLLPLSPPFFQTSPGLYYSPREIVPYSSPWPVHGFWRLFKKIDIRGQVIKYSSETRDSFHQCHNNMLVVRCFSLLVTAWFRYFVGYFRFVSIAARAPVEQRIGYTQYTNVLRLPTFQLGGALAAEYVMAVLPQIPISYWHFYYIPVLFYLIPAIFLKS